VGSGSDIVYRDTLDADPFDEKAQAARYSEQGERREEGDELDEDGSGSCRAQAGKWRVRWGGDGEAAR
jgi:hypothetical protein